MSNLSSFLGPPYLSSTIRIFTSSTTFTPVRNLLALVTVVGGGGSGGASNTSLLVGYIGQATGGGAGGFSQALVRLAAGVTYTITVGAGGARVTGNSNGNNGVASSVSGTGFTTLTGGAGSGGLYRELNGYTISTAYNLAGGAGGTATNGDIAATGGNGGAITYTSPGSNYTTPRPATGGGAVNCYNKTSASVSGGDITVTTRANSDASLLASGGGGVGGNGGNIPSNSDDTNAATGGGGAGSAAADGTSGVGAGGGGLTTDEGVKAYMPAGAGGAARLSSSAGIASYAGGGTGGTTGSTDTAQGQTGLFGGSGGTSGLLNTNGLPAGFGGGGGANCVLSGTNYSNAGGQGVVFIDYIPL
jgi:hypothetical protein